MNQYVSREIVMKVLGPGAEHVDIILEEFGTPAHFIIPKVVPYGISMIQEMYDKARLTRAYLCEDEGVTYP